MIDLLTNDTAILLFGAVGLMTTAYSIVRDARNQREQSGQSRVPVVADRVRVES